MAISLGIYPIFRQTQYQGGPVMSPQHPEKPLQIGWCWVWFLCFGVINLVYVGMLLQIRTIKLIWPILVTLPLSPKKHAHTCLFAEAGCAKIYPHNSTYIGKTFWRVICIHQQGLKIKLIKPWKPTFHLAKWPCLSRQTASGRKNAAIATWWILGGLETQVGQRSKSIGFGSN